MSVANLLSCLDGVKNTGPDRWLAKCPSHEDRTASLSIRELGDGRVLCHCFAGCSVHEVLGAVGLQIDELFPEKPLQHGRPDRRPFPAADVLRAIGYEALVVSAAAAALLSGEPFTPTDRERLILAASRIQGAISAAGLGVRHG